MELSFRFAGRDGQQAMRLIEHIQKHHLEEAGVGKALTQMLIDVGLLRPDGTPVELPEAPEPAMAEAAAAEPSGLWTPDSASPAPAAENSGRRSREAVSYQRSAIRFWFPRRAWERGSASGYPNLYLCEKVAAQFRLSQAAPQPWTIS